MPPAEHPFGRRSRLNIPGMPVSPAPQALLSGRRQRPQRRFFPGGLSGLAIFLEAATMRMPTAKSLSIGGTKNFVSPRGANAKPGFVNRAAPFISQKVTGPAFSCANATYNKMGFCNSKLSKTMSAFTWRYAQIQLIARDAAGASAPYIF